MVGAAWKTSEDIGSLNEIRHSYANSSKDNHASEAITG
jgi:hypothetical protein